MFQQFLDFLPNFIMNITDTFLNLSDFENVIQINCITITTEMKQLNGEKHVILLWSLNVQLESGNSNM